MRVGADYSNNILDGIGMKYEVGTQHLMYRDFTFLLILSVTVTEGLKDILDSVLYFTRDSGPILLMAEDVEDYANRK